ncbi:MAG TPA: PAS domain S-box protein, partial [Miltoncostaeaceae bacterium]|nr:PAS domain S-box protein [Miltoncostaeaceae bacterium]
GAVPAAPAGTAPAPADLRQGVVVYDAAGRIVAVNPGLEALTGFRAAEVVGRTGPPPWWPPEESERLRRSAPGVRPGAVPARGEFTLVHRDGTRFQARVDSVALPAGDEGPGGVVIVIEDITERLLAEEVGRESRRTYELIAENSSDVVARLSASLRFLFVSPSTERVLGRRPDALRGHRLLDLVHPDDAERVRAEHAAFAAEGSVATITFRARHADGRWLWLEVVCHPLRDDRGRLVESHVSARDITDRREAEEQSRRMAEELGFVARHAGDMISVHDPDGAYREVSEASWALLERSPGSLLGLHPLSVIHPDDRAGVAANLAQMAEGEGYSEAMTYRAARPDGSSVWLDSNLRAVYDETGRLQRIIAITRDATARVAAEREASARADRSDREAAEQAALRRVAIAVATENDASAAFGMVADEVPRLLDADVGHVLRAEDDGTLAVIASGGAAVLQDGDVIAPAPESALARMMATGRTARAADPSLGEAHDAGAPASTVAAPVRVEGRLWGAVVALGRRGRVVPPGAEARLERFAELVSVAISAAETRAALAAQALTDPLTGLANHRAFHERLREEVSRARRYERPLSLAVIDIDHFKRLNDLHGHQAGDRVLAAIATRLNRTARTAELVARVGGEEFAWILPECDADAAALAVERARAAVGSEPLWAGERVTVSAGVCSLTVARDAGELYRLADSALYWAKANGRDAVCVYSREMDEALSVVERAQRMERTQTLVALRSLARAVDAKDSTTKAHSDRVAAFSHAVALALGWSPERAIELREAGLLHDVGKIGVPDAVLLKPGPLDEEEREAVRRHAALGAGITSDALSPEQCLWIRHHHEHWDG